MSFRPFDNLAGVLSTKRLREGLQLVDAGKVLDAAREFLILPIELLKRHKRVKDIAQCCYTACKKYQALQRPVEALEALKRSHELGFSHKFLADRLRLLNQWQTIRTQISFNLEENRRLLHAGGLWPKECITLHDCLRQKEVLVPPTLPMPPQVKVSAWTALGRYQPRLQRSWTKLIRAYKEAPAVGLARAFAAVTYEHLVLQGWFAQIDLIVPIPPNPVKFAKRGFAPTDLLAKELETACAIPSYPILDRTVPESDTQESDYADVLATYSAKPKWEGVVAGANVLLVEDIITKGKNINAGGTRLFELKAEGVFVVALALTQDS